MSLQIHTTELDGVLVIEPKVFRDERGFFMESYNAARYAEHGITIPFIQDNHSQSRQGVLRGIHYQDLSSPIDKLVRCSRGRILDVAVDLRVGSSTFGRSVAVELSEENNLQLLVPVGFGHAFLTLSEVAEVQYKCSTYYAPAAEGAVRWDDPELAIDWPITNPTISARDQAAMSLAEYREKPAFRV